MEVADSDDDFQVSVPRPRAAETSEGVKKCRGSGLHWDRVFRCSTEEGLLKWLEANQSQDGCLQDGI